MNEQELLAGIRANVAFHETEVKRWSNILAAAGTTPITSTGVNGHSTASPTVVDFIRQHRDGRAATKREEVNRLEALATQQGLGFRRATIANTLYKVWAEKPARTAKAATAPTKHRTMSPAERKATSKRMKAYWAARRAGG